MALGPGSGSVCEFEYNTKIKIPCYAIARLLNPYTYTCLQLISTTPDTDADSNAFLIIIFRRISKIIPERARKNAQ